MTTDTYAADKAEAARHRAEIAAKPRCRCAASEQYPNPMPAGSIIGCTCLLKTRAHRARLKSLTATTRSF